MDLSVINFNFWIWQSIIMGLTALAIPRLRITSIFGALLMVVALGLVNSHFWDAALFFSLPSSVTTQTLLLFLCNGIIFWILVKILPGIEVTGILPALVAPAVFSIISLLVGSYLSKIDFIDLAKKGLVKVETTREYFMEQPNKTASEDKKSDSKEK